MTIKRPMPPTPSLDAVRRSFALSSKGKATASLASTLRVKPDLGAPNALEIFVLGLDHFLDAAALEHVVSVGWVYLLDQQPSPTSAEVYYQRDGSVHKLGSINRGVVTDKITSAVGLLDTFAADGEYEPRLLRIPALLHVFIWMKATDGADRFISVSAMTDLMPDLRPLAWADVQRALREHASVRIAADAPNKLHRGPLD
jgi:hypothetical protein